MNDNEQDDQVIVAGNVEDVQEAQDAGADEAAQTASDAATGHLPAPDGRDVVSTHGFAGTRVVGGKKGNKRIGKVRRFVFHPTEKRCIGFMVKRPDLLLMFHRKPLFVTLDGYEMDDGRVRIGYKDPDHQGPSACKRLGVDFDRCVLWEGMPLVTLSGEELGYVGDIEYERDTGEVVSVSVDEGGTRRALLGVKTVPASLIRGFRTGIGHEIATMGHEGEQQDEASLGAILLDDAALELKPEGGIAESAGRSSAVIGQKAHEASVRAKPKVDEAAHNAHEEIDAAAYATGRQLGRTKGMFSNFKKEYDKAVNGTGDYDEEEYSYLDDDPDDELGRGMFSKFKENYDAAVNGDDDDADEDDSSEQQEEKPASNNMFARFKQEYDKAVSGDDDDERHE